jgi:hypothetical protein
MSKEGCSSPEHAFHVAAEPVFHQEERHAADGEKAHADVIGGSYCDLASPEMSR